MIDPRALLAVWTLLSFTAQSGGFEWPDGDVGRALSRIGADTQPTLAPPVNWPSSEDDPAWADGAPWGVGLLFKAQKPSN